ncbi:ArgE/DapE family deacylase [Brevibacillus fluminis]|uniref:ArgE/DapE family deacylase n=1 Tax=Brevibacillus fluminis TaxID=511487 RepID=A0A3M8DHS2_9BACL|nr:ArgE/DapE family deacylase [Brevibacillus fluminis]RNB87652.1 ArgE/DapE family deacylase [Brevibacillus fluminis]
MNKFQCSEMVNEWMRKNQEHMVGLLKEMVGFKSINPKFLNSASSSESDQLQEFLKDYLLSLGLRVDKWDVYDNQPNVVATLKGKTSENSLILNGHIDVVPAGDLSQWTTDPWKAQIYDGKLFGRGTLDMKAGVASNIMVSKFMVDHGIQLNHDLQLHIVVDEEGGGSGTRSALNRGYTGGGVIVTEPTDAVLTPVEGGLYWLRLRVKGNNAHSGWRYSHIYPGYQRTGVNVIEKSLKILQAIMELERDWGLNKYHPLLPPGITTINPGVMLAGAGNKDGYPETVSNPAIVPDHCVMEFALKYLPDEDPEEIKKQFEEFIRCVCYSDSWLKECPPEIEWGVHGVSFPPVNTPIDHRLVAAAATSQKTFGIDPTYKGFTAVSDAAFYAKNNIPSMLYGPCGARLHGPDEYVELASLYEVTKVLIMTTLEWNNLIQEESCK